MYWINVMFRGVCFMLSQRSSSTCVKQDFSVRTTRKINNFEEQDTEEMV